MSTRTTSNQQTLSRVNELKGMSLMVASEEPISSGLRAKTAQVLASVASSLERRIDKPPAAVLQLPSGATAEELKSARQRQSVRKGEDVYLPVWADCGRVMPHVFARSALFTASRREAGENDKVLKGEASLLVANQEVASLSNFSLRYTGYPLCQFDRQVYAACLELYRERPLSSEDARRYVKVSFYKFSELMEKSYSTKLHVCIYSSLLRLSSAHIRLRTSKVDLELPKLLSVSVIGDDMALVAPIMRGSDSILISISEDTAELFGQGSWSSVNSGAVGIDGLKGWLANFYRSHSSAHWLPVETLKKCSGYKADLSNFRKGLVSALEALKSDKVPSSCRVKSYTFSKDKKEIKVVLAAWADEK